MDNVTFDLDGNQNTVIFDLDGTIANIDDRRSISTKDNGKKPE